MIKIPDDADAAAQGPPRPYSSELKVSTHETKGRGPVKTFGIVSHSVT